jgi:copper(I)-binding protein
VKAQATIARRIGIGLAAACATLLTASCATGQHAATANEVPAIDGTSGQVGSISAHAVAVVAPAFACYLPGSAAALTMVIVSSGDSNDTLTGVTSPRFSSSIVLPSSDDANTYVTKVAGSGSCSPSATASAAPSAPAQTLPAAVTTPPTIAAGQSLQINVADTGTDTSANPAVVLRGLVKGALYPGESIPVTLTFANAGDLTMTVPVSLSLVANNSVIPTGTGTAGE